MRFHPGDSASPCVPGPGGRWLFPLASPKYPLQFLLDLGTPCTAPSHTGRRGSNAPSPVAESPNTWSARQHLPRTGDTQPRHTMHPGALGIHHTRGRSGPRPGCPAPQLAPGAWAPHPPLQQAGLSPGLRGPLSPSQGPPGTWPSRLKKRRGCSLPLRLPACSAFRRTQSGLFLAPQLFPPSPEPHRSPAASSVSWLCCAPHPRPPQVPQNCPGLPASLCSNVPPENIRLPKPSGW